MLLQSQRSISCWVAPHTSIPGGRFLQISWGPQKSTRMGPSSQYFDSLPTCCMRSSHEDCSVDDNYLVQVWMSCHRVCPLTAVLYFALPALMLLLLMPLPWIVLLPLQTHMWAPKWSQMRKILGTRLQHPPLLMTLQRSPHSVVLDDDCSQSGPRPYVCMNRNCCNCRVIFPESRGQKLVPLYTTNLLFHWRRNCTILIFSLICSSQNLFSEPARLECKVNVPWNLRYLNLWYLTLWYH